MLKDINYRDKEKIELLKSVIQSYSIKDIPSELLKKMAFSKKAILERIFIYMLSENPSHPLTEEAFVKILIKGSGDERVRRIILLHFSKKPPTDKDNYEKILKFSRKLLKKINIVKWDNVFTIARYGNYPELNERLNEILLTKTEPRYAYLKALIINNAENILGEKWKDILRKIHDEQDKLIKKVIKRKLKEEAETPLDKIDIDLKSNEDRIKGAVFGLAIGDAMGAQVENLSREEILDNYGLVTDFVPPIYTNTPIGEYTDDTELTLLLFEDILENSNFDKKSFAQKLAKKSQDMDEMKDYNRGYSHRTLQAMHRLKMGQAPELSGNDSITNGVAIRMIPLAVLALFDKKDRLLQNVRDNAMPTHNNQIAIEGAYLTVLATKYCLETEELNINELLDLLQKNAKSAIFKDQLSKVKELLESDVSYEEAEKILGASTKVQKSFPYALYCFLKNPDNYKEILISAININGDSDSVAAIAGSLYGALHGYSSLPKEWVEKVNCKDKINKLLE